VGSTNFPFDRLFVAIDNVLSELNSEAKLVVQMGYSTYMWRYKNVELHKYLKPKEMELIFLKADKIITHAGFGTLYKLSSKSRYMPLIVPRLNRHGEHINNHQRDFIDFLKKKTNRDLGLFIADKKIETSLLKYLSSSSSPNYLYQYIFYTHNENQISMNIDHYLSRM